jgi:hypothetical protein
MWDKYPKKYYPDSNYFAAGFINDTVLYGIHFETLKVDSLPCEFYKLSDLYELNITFAVKVTRLPDIPHFKSLKDVYYRGFDLSNTEVVIDERYGNIESLRLVLCNVSNIRFQGDFPRLSYLQLGGRHDKKIQFGDCFYKLRALEYLEVCGDALENDFTRFEKLKDVHISADISKKAQREFVERNKHIPLITISNQRGVYYYEYGNLTDKSEHEK